MHRGLRLEPKAIAWGCLAEAIATALLIIVWLAVLAAAGMTLKTFKPSAIPPGIVYVAFMLGLGVDILAGYVTARKAEGSKSLQVVVLGVLFMLVTLTTFFPIGPTLGEHLSAVSWVITIPLMLFGARFAVRQASNDHNVAT